MHSEITLYTNPMSRGQIARWMLEETVPCGQVRWPCQSVRQTAPALTSRAMGG